MSETTEISTFDASVMFVNKMLRKYILKEHEEKKKSTLEKIKDIFTKKDKSKPKEANKTMIKEILTLFVTKLASSWEMEEKTLVVATLYFVRLRTILKDLIKATTCQYCQAEGCKSFPCENEELFNVLRQFVICAMLASKVEEKYWISKKYFMILDPSGYSLFNDCLECFTGMEKYFLEKIEYNLFLSFSQYKGFVVNNAPRKSLNSMPGIEPGKDEATANGQAVMEPVLDHPN